MIKSLVKKKYVSELESEISYYILREKSKVGICIEQGEFSETRFIPDSYLRVLDFLLNLAKNNATPNNMLDAADDYINGLTFF